MRSRIQYTESQKAQMWSRWQQGESLHEIARLFDRFHTSVRGILAESGGIRPPPRRRSSRVLSLAEREEISRGVVGIRYDPSLPRSSERRPPSAVRSGETRDGMAIELVTLTGQLGTEPVVPSPVSWHSIQASRCGSRTSFNSIGPQSRSPAGSHAPIPKIGTVRCPTKRSTERYISSPAAL
jgi:hypothetical protein